mmetsp:Transcript_38748/g.58193  ORF Transcript_38748/g.58193 Transcript_38748/m.58193 type:complete len:96 (+) Transcript_38748:262-549(+)
MLFLTSSNYTTFLHWFLATVSANEAHAAVFMMWLNTEVMYAAVVTFFYFVEKSNKFQTQKIHSQPSDANMFRDMPSSSNPLLGWWMSPFTTYLSV